MTPLLAVFHFQIRDLWVDRELLGTTHYLERDAHSVLLTFPRDASDFELGLANRDWDNRAIASSGYFDERPEEKVRILEVTVGVNAPVSVARFQGATRDEAATTASALLDRTRKIAQGIVRDFVGWSRIVGPQPWLGRSEETPELVGREWLVDAEAGRPLPFGVERMQLRAIAREDALTEVKLERVLGHVSTESVVPLAERLLADAENVASWADHADPALGVVLAAIACEVKTKTMLSEQAPAAAAPLLATLFDSRIHLRVVWLLDKGARATLGRSLDDEDQPLLRRIADLFTLRNDVAHHGGFQRDANARDLIAAARELFEWLDSIETPS